MAALRLGVEMMLPALEVDLLARQLLGSVHHKVSPESIIREFSIGIHKDGLVTFCQEWMEGLATAITGCLFLALFLMSLKLGA